LSQGEPLAAICRSDEKFPHPSHWRDWCHEDDKLAIAYARAREEGEEKIASDCLEIADDGTNDYMEQRDKDDILIGWRLNGEHVQRSKLRIETRLKLLAKWNPKKWGEKTILAGDEENPIQIDHKSDIDIARLVAFQLTKAQKRAEAAEGGGSAQPDKQEDQANG
jgi:hypothetical protein